jgi:hypothetical protein
MPKKMVGKNKPMAAKRGVPVETPSQKKKRLAEEEKAKARMRK